MIEGRKNAKREAIELRWGMDFWSLISDFANQGLSRRQTGMALGYSWQHFHSILRNRPDADPFEEYGVIANYIRDTGEPLGVALRRMAASGYTFSQAQREIGYCDNGNPLRYAMKVRGIEVEFAEFKAKQKPKKEKLVSVSGRYGPKSKEHPWRKQAKREIAMLKDAPAIHG